MSWRVFGWLVVCVLSRASAAIGAHGAPGDFSGPEGNYEPALLIPPHSESYTTAYLNATILNSTGRVFTNFSEEEKHMRVILGSSPLVDCGRKPQEAKYGVGRIREFYGQLVHIASRGPEDDHSGCWKPLMPTTEFPEGPWIALIKRGTCNFDDKVQNAYDSKAIGVVVYNDRDSTILEKMKLTKNRNISSVFTFKYKGEELARFVDNGTKVMLHVTVATHCIRTTSPNMNKTSVLFVSISFILLMVMSLSWLVFYYIQRFRYMNAKERLSKRLCCAAKKALSKIPVKNLKSEDKEIQGEGECCAVCIEPYKISDVIRMLPCRHDFHKSCIDPWLLDHRTCPMCKMDILKYYGFVFTGSQESILQLDAEEGERRNTETATPLPRQLSHSSSYDLGHSDRSSRASSPDEMTPSLQQPSPSSESSGSPHFPKFLTRSMSDPTEFSVKKVAPCVHNAAAGCSRHPVETTVISNEHFNESEARNSV